MLHGSRCWIRGLQVLSRMLDAASSCFTSSSRDHVFRSAIRSITLVSSASTSEVILLNSCLVFLIFDASAAASKLLGGRSMELYRTVVARVATGQQSDLDPPTGFWLC